MSKTHELPLQTPDFAAMPEYDPAVHDPEHGANLANGFANGPENLSIAEEARQAAAAEHVARAEQAEADRAAAQAAAAEAAQVRARRTPMSVAERKMVQTVANTAAVVDLPKGALRTNLYATPAVERQAAFDEAKAKAAAALEDDKAAREYVRQRQQERDERRISKEQERFVGTKAESIEQEVEAEMAAKHTDLKPGAATMMREGLRDKVAKRHAAERLETIRRNGGAKNIDKLLTRERAAEEAAARAAKAAEARAKAEAEAQRNRIHGMGAAGEKNGVNKILREAPKAKPTPAKEADPVRPFDVTKGDWLRMSRREQIQAEAADKARGVDSADPELRLIERIASIERQYANDLNSMAPDDAKLYRALRNEYYDINKDSYLDAAGLGDNLRARVEIINHAENLKVSHDAYVQQIMSEDSSKGKHDPAFKPSPRPRQTTVEAEPAAEEQTESEPQAPTPFTEPEAVAFNLGNTIGGDKPQIPEWYTTTPVTDVEARRDPSTVAYNIGNVNGEAQPPAANAQDAAPKGWFGRKIALPIGRAFDNAMKRFNADPNGTPEQQQRYNRYRKVSGVAAVMAVGAAAAIFFGTNSTEAAPEQASYATSSTPNASNQQLGQTIFRNGFNAQTNAPEAKAVGAYNSANGAGTIEGWALTNLTERGYNISDLTPAQQEWITNELRKKTLELNGLTESSARFIQPNRQPVAASDGNITTWISEAIQRFPANR